jgi:P2 family phage contractile tail tube protein
MAEIKVLTGANVYINGGSRIGQVDTFESPSIVQKTMEYAGLGLTGAQDIPIGPDKMEATLKFAGMYGDTLKLVSDPHKKHDYMLRGNIDVVGSDGRTEQKPYKAEMKAYNLELKPGSIKRGDESAPEVKLGVRFYRLEIDGEEIVKIDLDNHIYAVAGEDKMGGYRGNLGI